MKKASLTKTEQRFLWTVALVCAVCVALAFGFAVPRQTGPGRAAGSETPLIRTAQVEPSRICRAMPTPDREGSIFRTDSSIPSKLHSAVPEPSEKL